MAPKGKAERVASHIWTANAALRLTKRLLLGPAPGDSSGLASKPWSRPGDRQCAPGTGLQTRPAGFRALDARLLCARLEEEGGQVQRSVFPGRHPQTRTRTGTGRRILSEGPVPPATWAGGDGGTEPKEEEEGPLTSTPAAPESSLRPPALH